MNDEEPDPFDCFCEIGSNRAHLHCFWGGWHVHYADDEAPTA